MNVQHLPSMLGLNKPEGEPGAALPSILVGLFAAFAGILYGMCYPVHEFGISLASS